MRYTENRMQPRGLSALGTLFAFIMILIILGVLWVATGGPSRPISHAGPFLSPPTVPSVAMNTGQVVSGSESQVDNTPIQTPGLWDIFFASHGGVLSNATGNSPYSSIVQLSADAAGATDPNSEYITIRINPNTNSNVTVSGWTIENKQKAIKVTLGSAAQLFQSGDVNSQLPVTAGPGSVLYVVTGRSPNGVSFRTNKCAAYLEQFQDFTPSLYGSCPAPQDEALLSGNANSQACINFLNQIPQCQTYTRTLPDSLDSNCKNFIQNSLTYTGCVTRHKNDPDFYKNEWHLYLNRDQELWDNSHDQVLLYDENGKLVGAATY